MKPELTAEEQMIDLPGQMSFFPEMEADDAAPRIRLQHPISPPDTAKLEEWKFSILMSDILLRFEGRLPERWLYEIMVSSGYVSHFLYQDLLGGMIENGAAVIENDDGSEAVVLTQAGIQNVKKTRLLVPKVFRDQVHLTALRYVTRQKAMRDLQITYEPDESGCKVCLRCLDHGQEMFFLRITAPSHENAEELAERVMRNPARFFGKIIDLAMTNEEEPFDLTDN